MAWGNRIISVLIVISVFLTIGIVQGLISIEFEQTFEDGVFIGIGNGRYLPEKPLDAEVDVVFDYPFPLDGATGSLVDVSMYTINSQGNPANLVSTKTLKLKNFVMDNLGTCTAYQNGKWIYGPSFFDYDLQLDASVQETAPISFQYRIEQSPMTTPPLSEILPQGTTL